MLYKKYRTVKCGRTAIAVLGSHCQFAVGVALYNVLQQYGQIYQYFYEIVFTPNPSSAVTLPPLPWSGLRPSFLIFCSVGYLNATLFLPACSAAYIILTLSSHWASVSSSLACPVVSLTPTEKKTQIYLSQYFITLYLKYRRNELLLDPIGMPPPPPLGLARGFTHRL